MRMANADMRAESILSSKDLFIELTNPPNWISLADHQRDTKFLLELKMKEK